MKPRFLSTVRLAFLRAAALVVALAAPSAFAKTLYWDGTGIWTETNNWSLVSGAPFDQTWAAGDDAVFDVANSTITGATALFNSITANQTVTMTAGGTLSPYFTADVTVAAGKTFSFGGQNNNTGQVLGGNGGIRKLGAGELVFGNANNTYTGGFAMNAGTVTVWNNNALGQGGALELNGGTLRSGGGNQNLSGKFSDITIGGDFGLDGNGGGFTFDAPTYLGDAMRAINVGNVHTFNGVISGDPGGGIIKGGGGTLVLGGDNDFTGPVIINGGYLSPTTNNALGTTDGDTTINGGGGSPAADFEFLTPTLTLFRAGATTGSDLTIAENLNFRASAAGLCTLLNTTGGSFPISRDHTLTGAIDVTSAYNSVNFTSESGSFTFIGNIIGTMTFGSNLQLRGSSSNISNRVLGSLNLSGGDLVKTGNGFWLVGAAGAGKIYNWNNTRMANGILQLGLANILPPSGLLIMGNSRAGTFGGSNGFLDLNGFDQTVAGITYVGGLDEGVNGWTSGTRRITSTTPAVLTVNNASDYSPAGFTPSTRVLLEGALGLKKEGVGKLTLSGTNTHTGATTVTGGTLALGALTALSDTSPVVLGAARLDVDSAGTEIAGTLDVTAAATLKLAAGAKIAFADSSASALDWTGGTLNVTGAFVSGVSLKFGNSSGGLKPAQLARISVNGSGAGNATLDPDGYLIAGSAYDTWATNRVLAGAPDFETNRADDPDQDGRDNLEEFAFDGDPLSAANDGKIVGKVAAVSGSQVLTLTLPVRIGANFGPNGGDQLAGPVDGIYYRIEGSNDLITFADTVTEVTLPDQTPIQADLPPLSSTDWSYRTFRVSGTVSTQPKAFLRAKVSETP